MAKIVLYLAFICITATSIVHGFDVNVFCGDDWIPFEDEKCVRIFTGFANRNDAERACNQEDATLVIIKTATEQRFLRELVLNSTNPTHVWIGAERRPNSDTDYEWNDGSAVDRFSDWAVGFPEIDDRRSCVVMRKDGSPPSLQWGNFPCNIGAWFICQKVQTWPFDHLQNAILDARRNMEYTVLRFTDQLSDLTTKLNNANSELKYLSDNPVPIGFVYTQLPNQPEPWRLWWSVEWTEITENTALGAVPEFGSIQAENSPRNAVTRFWTRTK